MFESGPERISIQPRAGRDEVTKKTIASVFCVICVLMVAARLSAQQMPAGGSEHVLGKKLTVYHVPLNNLAGKLGVYHTYPVAIDNGGKQWPWGALGRKSGGTVLADTTTQCNKDCIDVSTVNFLMSEAPCIWPYKRFYAVVGVCFNAANRGLYYTGKTVHKVKYYRLVEMYFGTYGLDTRSKCRSKRCQEGKEKFAWSRCLKAVEEKFPWQGRSYSALIENGNEVDPRIPLYERYFGTQVESAQSPSNREEQYLAALFELNIDESLGADVDPEKRQQMQKVRQESVQAFRDLEMSEDSHEVYLESFNRISNTALERFADILDDREYIALFGAREGAVFDVRLLQ